MLLNNNGYWLSHPNPKRCWGFMFEGRAKLTMANTDPDMWAHIQAAETGQFEYQGSLISFATVHPFAMFPKPLLQESSHRDHTRYWKVVSQFPAKALDQRFFPILERTLLFSSLIWMLLSLLIGTAIKARANKARVEDERQHLLKQTQALSKTLIKASDQERNDIALSLHDEFGQLASAIHMQAEFAAEALHAGNNAMAIKQVNEIEHATDQLIRSTRRILKRLNPSHLHELGLVESIKAMCHEWHRISQVPCTISCQGTPIALTEQTALNLYRIAQESLTNIVRHADASSVTIEFYFHPYHLTLTIHDNGCGFDTHTHHNGLGLVGIAQRIQNIDGTMQIDSYPDHGTTLTITVPLNASNQHNEENP